jgi:hypothetical protein
MKDHLNIEVDQTEGQNRVFITFSTPVYVVPDPEVDECDPREY